MRLWACLHIRGDHIAHYCIERKNLVYKDLGMKRIPHTSLLWFFFKYIKSFLRLCMCPSVIIIVTHTSKKRNWKPVWTGSLQSAGSNTVLSRMVYTYQSIYSHSHSCIMLVSFFQFLLREWNYLDFGGAIMPHVNTCVMCKSDALQECCKIALNKLVHQLMIAKKRHPSLGECEGPKSLVMRSTVCSCSPDH